MNNINMRRKHSILALVLAIILIVLSQQYTNWSAPQQTGEASSLVPVSRTVDGDTIEVLINGQPEKVRLIGVNTPETVDPRKPVECFGHEASDFTAGLLDGQQVRLEADSSQGDKDKYGRLLRYVFLPDGTFLNEEIVSQGYGYEYTYDKPYQYQEQFRHDQAEAEQAGKGLWAPDACSSS